MSGKEIVFRFDRSNKFCLCVKISQCSFTYLVKGWGTPACGGLRASFIRTNCLPRADSIHQSIHKTNHRRSIDRTESQSVRSSRLEREEMWCQRFLPDLSLKKGCAGNGGPTIVEMWAVQTCPSQSLKYILVSVWVSAPWCSKETSIHPLAAFQWV